MSLDQRPPFGLFQAELTAVFGPHHLTSAHHANQRNETWLLRSAQMTAVVKWYRWLSNEAAAGVIEAEDRARSAGLPVPAVLYRSPQSPFVVYDHIDGAHQVPQNAAVINTCAELFMRQLLALQDFEPLWTPMRPNVPPRRAQTAISNCRDSRLALAISDSWQQLTTLARERPAAASHTDWRADNILFLDDQITAVLDWEDVVLLPAAEAVGYAAGSLTHSWRETLHKPLTLLAVTTFLTAAASRLSWQPGSPEMAHARLATFFTSAVRLAEDLHRAAARISFDELRATLGE